MQIIIKTKSFSKRGLALEPRHLEIGKITSPLSAKLLLIKVVHALVEDFNQRLTQLENQGSDKILTENYMDILNLTGKVGFGDLHKREPANLEKATEIVSLAYEDGLFAFFHNDELIESLDKSLEIKDTSEFAFVKLTFLAGSIW